MLKIVKAVIVFATLQDIVLARVAPDFIKACPAITPACLKKNIQDTLPAFIKGVPSLNIEPTDPLQLMVKDFEPQAGIKLSLDGRMTGIKTCIVDSAKYEKNILDIDLHCNITIKGKYQASGRILIVSINGDGDAKIKGNNIIVNARLKFEDQVRNGITYHVLKDTAVKHRFGDRVHFALTNLFKGNPEISNAVLTFLNENWKEVAHELGTPVVNLAVKRVLDIVKKLFTSVPKSELFP
ncbi:hypothetical protein JYU34_017130 [Plutella xylostella]|uniref:Uncharacterized protein n=2 Tax=Plutella xylostella TaxID=51655 RepID=A0ABQ7Q0G8_PLUXY|nr:circadian clock-controlled protein daywake [Plutella xylostella]KAG7298722.1 hypothetical protein JYU34_017130 [Plutella xylostella]CAG9133554.1 unnamed protein product [Plutella xylostella]